MRAFAGGRRDVRDVLRDVTDTAFVVLLLRLGGIVAE